MHLTVFRNRKRAGMDMAAYADDAARMGELARKQPGFLSFKTYVAEDGEVVTISEWRDAAAAQAFRMVADHSAVQARGRREYYQDYTLFSCDNPQVRTFRSGDDR